MKSVMLVEDNEQSRYYLQALLEGHGWLVTTASNGSEALANARSMPPDLVISDLLMPVMDGYTLLRQWKGDSRLSGVPFVVYTATYTESEDERLALALGADAFILKPAEPEDFIKRIDDVQAGALAHRAHPRLTTAPDDAPLLKLYSEALIRRLEHKSLQLEATNRALEEEQAELRMRDRAIQAVSQGIVITDPHAPDHPIIYASPSFLKLTGYALHEVMGRNCRFLQGEGTEREAISQLGAAVKAGRACTQVVRNYRKDGSPFWNHLAISPVFDASGALLQFVGVQTDVTEQRELEERLRQVQKMQAIGQLAAGIAHDFNNLISVVLGYSISIAEQLKPGDPLREDIEEVRRAGERANDLVRQLLAVGRQQVRKPRVLDLGQVVLGMESLLRRVVGAKVVLSLSTTSGLGAIEADPTQLEQIIMNLAVNARDAMPEGGELLIEVVNCELDGAYAAAHGEVAAGSYVMLSVTDSGVGMTPATRERIFEPFFTTKEVGKGTGLGLSTVFGVVKQSKGHLTVHTEEGRGTAFKIYFPRVDGALQQAGAADDPIPEPTTLLGTETILLIEDDDQLRAMLGMILRRHGYDVLDAKNAAEAISMSDQWPRVDLLLLDAEMPRVHGGQLAERTAPLSAIKVLVMSGYGGNAVVHHAAPGIDAASIQKPITPNTLLRKVREVLDAAPRSSSSSQSASERVLDPALSEHQ